MTTTQIRTIGLIGTGAVGSQLARLAVRSGYQVVVSNSRGPGSLDGLVAELGASARAGTVEDAATFGDLVIVSTPLSAYEGLPAERLAGKVVVDTGNYYPARDGVFAELDAESTTSSELLQSQLKDSPVVKAFNHIEAQKLTEDSQKPGTTNRRALVIAGDNDDAKALVAGVIERFGFDVLDIGALSEGWRVQYPNPSFARRGTRDEMSSLVAAATEGHPRRG